MKNFDRIEQYLQGELSTEEQATFEAAINSNPDLNKEFKKHQLAYDSMELLIEDNLRDQFKAWKKEDQKKETGGATIRQISWGRRITNWSVAAVILALMGFIALRWTGQSYSDTQLASQYYEQPNEIGIRNNIDNQLTAIDDLISNNKWQEALQQLETITSTGAQDPAILELIAHCQFELKQYDKAIANYELLINSRDSRYAAKAEWNQILAQLTKDGINDDLKAEIEEIANDENHDYKEQAQKLLDKLNSFFRNF